MIADIIIAGCTLFSKWMHFYKKKFMCMLFLNAAQKSTKQMEFQYAF